MDQKRRMTQNDRVLDYLQTHPFITPIEALNELGIFRLGARAFDLRKSGHPIRSYWYEIKDRNGETCRVKAYTLEDSLT